MKPVYHYTTKDRVQSILAAEEIKPATAGVKPPEIPAVWLSTAEKWEHTATKILVRRNGRRELGCLMGMIEFGATLARIRIDPDRVSLIHRHELQAALNIPPAILKHLVKSAKQSGANPAEWRAVAGAVPISAILTIELSTHCQPFNWTVIDPATLRTAAA